MTINKKFAAVCCFVAIISIVSGIVGYCIGSYSAQKTYRYYTVFGYVTEGITHKPVGSVCVQLCYDKVPLASIYTDENGFYRYSFLGVEGATVRLMATGYFASPYWVEIQLGSDCFIQQSFRVWW